MALFTYCDKNNIIYYIYYIHSGGVSVRSFLPPRASRPRNIGTYVFCVTRKTLLYNYYNRDFFAENVSF